MKSPLTYRAVSRRSLLPAILVATLLGGCDRYIFTVNEQPVYKPPTLFTDYRIVDAALRGCVEQTIADQKISRAGDLTHLICTHAEIGNLEGLEIFSALANLNLADNDLNGIQPLLMLPNLATVDLSNNDHLDCKDAKTLADQVDSVRLPKHCG
ncbi:MAG: leucine-rich repeat domain-containing protein [Porticoccaceae bacterium]